MSQFGEIRIILNHGYIESEEEIIDKAKKMGGDILVLGHTHVKKLYMDDNLIVINPGSTSIPKDGSHSVAIIDIIKTDDEDELELDINLIDINTGNIININD
ncbi:calcineurin-like phosphoesterase superfamily domain protein [Clostridioides difficile DA00193]|nr:calcineurin-like phosphoesterase superfamily domain protein [Clostridioides difficile DA00193]